MIRSATLVALCLSVSVAAEAADDFQFQIPEGWRRLTGDNVVAEGIPNALIREAMSGKYAVYAVDPRGDSITTVGATFNAVEVQTTGRINQGTLEQYVSGLAKGAPAGVRIKIDESRLVKLKGVDVGMFAGSVQGPDGTMSMLQYLVPGKKQSVILTYECAPKDYERYRPVFESAAMATTGAYAQGKIEGSGAVVLEYGSVLKALPAIFVFLWALIFLVLAVVEPPRASDLPAIFGLVGLITALLVPLALEVRGVAHRISPAGIQKVAPWSPPLVIPWRDVRSVIYESSMAWFVVESRQGRVRVSRFLDGLADFRRALETNVPRDRWAAAFGAAPAIGSTRARAEHGEHAEPSEHERTRTEDLKSHAAGLVVLVAGAGLSAMAWFEALHEGEYSVKAAFVGPQAVVLGIGLLVHGRGIPTGGGATSLTRAYGFAGGVVALLNLYFLDYFKPPGRAHLFIFLTLLVWLLPSRFFRPSRLFGRDGATERGASRSSVPPKKPKPIEPR